MAKMSRKTIILNKSMEMFNESGIQNVPVYKLAAALDISSGNVTYYFKNKEELVYALVNRLEAEMIAVLKREVDTSSVDSVSYQLARIVATLWRYRFFFNTEFALSSDAPELKSKYFQLRDSVVSALRKTFDRTIEKKAMRPFREPNNSQLLADNIWAMWLMWLKEDQVNGAGESAAVSGAMRQSAIHYFSLVEPYLSAKFAPLFYQSLLQQFASKA